MRLREINQLWTDVVDLVNKTKLVTTLKEQAEAEVIEVNIDSLKLLLKKGKTITLRKRDFEKALNVLSEKGRARQKFINNPEVERYILGIMMMLPHFEKVEEFDEQASKKKKFLKCR